MSPAGRRQRHESREPAPPLVSVYITNHNYGRFLQQSIQSVLDQSLQDFELIIIDDGSTDNSREIIEQYAAHPKVTVIYQQNRGLNISNNIALRTAVGKYIMRLDADDYLDPNALLVMTNRLEREPELGLVFPDYYLVDTEGQVLSLERRHNFENEVSLLDQPAHGACTMIRRAYLLEVGGYDESFRCQDGYELWLKFVAKYKVANINLPLFYYRRHGENLTAREEALLETRAAIKRLHAMQLEPVRAAAIVPVRGRQASHASFALEPLGRGRVIDGLLEAALQARTIQLTVLTTPDVEIERYVRDRYGNRVIVMERELAKARLNTGLSETIQDTLQHPRVREFDPEVLVTLSIRHPLITAAAIDDAVHTYRIFDCDSVISVRPETGKLYRHEGHGMRLFYPQDKLTRLEREALFRNAGGITLTSVAWFNAHRTLVGERVGHVVVDRNAALEVDSDWELATRRPRT